MKTLGNIDDNVFSSLTLTNGTSFVTITAPPTGIYILSLPPNLGSSGQVLTTNGTGQTYWAPAAPANYISSVDSNFQVTAGLLSFSSTFSLNYSTLTTTVNTNTTSINTINSRQITLSVPSFLSITGSPAIGAAGSFVIGLGAGALPSVS